MQDVVSNPEMAIHVITQHSHATTDQTQSLFNYCFLNWFQGVMLFLVVIMVCAFIGITALIRSKRS